MSDLLTRFIEAQRTSYPQALAELRAGAKRSHWMWYVFPQIAGLGKSDVARHYAIRDSAEARAYLNHPVLGKRLVEAAGAVLAHPDVAIERIMGSIDALKLRSSMTLFAAVACDDAAAAPFRSVLTTFYGGQDDPETLRRIA